MKKYILTKPTDEYSTQIAEYRQEFLDAGDSMDGCGSLRVMENPFDFIKKCKDYEQRIHYRKDVLLRPSSY